MRPARRNSRLTGCCLTARVMRGRGFVRCAGQSSAGRTARDLRERLQIQWEQAGAGPNQSPWLSGPCGPVGLRPTRPIRPAVPSSTPSVGSECRSRCRCRVGPAFRPARGAKSSQVHRGPGQVPEVVPLCGDVAAGRQLIEGGQPTGYQHPMGNTGQAGKRRQIPSCSE